MSRWFANVIAGLCMSCVATPLLALSYTPMSDQSLLAQAPAVVTATVMARDISATVQGVTRYQLAVQEVYKGMVPATTITVTVPGNPLSRVIQGIASMQVGEQVVIFITPHSDGSWGLMQLNLGLFHVRDGVGGKVLLRGLKDAVRVDAATPIRKMAADGPRQAEAFRNWLIRHNPAPSLLPGRMPAAIAVPQAVPDRIQPKYTLLVDSNGKPARWFLFDQGSSVTFKAGSTPQPGMSEGGYAEFQQALTAWDNLPDSNIKLVYGGKTAANAGLATRDGINAILFDDPNHEISGSYDCHKGGVLALGGYATLGTAYYKGRRWAAISEADIVTNDNAGCFFQGHGGANGAEIFAHELGHSLGFGHSCGDNWLLGLANDCLLTLNGAADAIMRAYPHADGRGAKLKVDDSRAATYVYGNGSALPSDGLLGLGDGSSSDNNSSDSGGHDPGPDSGAQQAGASSGGGGCTLQPRTVGMDPTLPGLLLLAGVMLGWRRLAHE